MHNAYILRTQTFVTQMLRLFFGYRFLLILVRFVERVNFGAFYWGTISMVLSLKPEFSDDSTQNEMYTYKTNTNRMRYCSVRELQWSRVRNQNPDEFIE